MNYMTDNLCLIDSNILLYAIDTADKHKHELAKELLTRCWAGKIKYSVSLQNLSEFFVNATQKISTPITDKDAAEIIKTIIEFQGWNKIAPTKETVVEAIQLSTKNNVHYWDALIAATMIENKIFTIITENTKDFNKIQGIKAKNPFL